MDDKLTIVGPEPSGRGRSTPARVNIEALLLMAKYDDQYRRLLLEDRARALAECGIRFSKSELILLTGLSREKLAAGIEEFSLPGISRESLPSWKEAAAIVMLVMSVIVGSSVQGADEPTRGIAPDQRPDTCSEPARIDFDSFQEGWCDADTFRIMAEGYAPDGETDIQKRREKAQEAAVILAQYRFMEKIIGARIEAGGIMSDEESGDFYRKRELLKKEVKELFAAGKLLAAK